jgi:hypothetical protein
MFTEKAMEDIQDFLNPEIQTIVERQLEPNECIHGWMRTPTDDIVVFIGNKAVKGACEVAARKLGRPFRSELPHVPWWEIGEFLGRGRSLVFAQENGAWKSVGLGSWGVGPGHLLKYYKIMAKDDPNPHWQHGIEMCCVWQCLRVSKLRQEHIDQFLARLRVEPDAGVMWWDFRAQFMNWARNKGFRVE